MTKWKQERPDWCPHADCVFRRRAMDSICGGELPEPEPHDADENTHRLCLNGASDDGGVFDLQVNRTDLGWLRWVFDAMDGQETSWLSRRNHHGTQDPADKPTTFPLSHHTGPPGTETGAA